MNASYLAVRAVKFAKHISKAARKSDHRSARDILATAYKYNPEPYFQKCLSLALKYEDRFIQQGFAHVPARRSR